MQINSTYLKIFIFLTFSNVQLSAQSYIAVVEFTGKGISQTDASILSDRIRSDIFNTGKYRVVERERMEEILKEQGFQLSGCVTNECIVEAGRLIGAEQIIGGSISKLGKIYSISARILNVETGEILNIATFDYEGKIEELLISGTKKVINDLISNNKKEKFKYRETTKKDKPSLKALSPIEDPFKISVAVGLNFANFSHKDFNEDIKSGLIGGLLITYRISNLFELKSGLLYSARGKIITRNIDGEEKEGKNYFNYIELPLLAKISFMGSISIKPTISFGPSISYNLLAEWEVDTESGKYEEVNKTDYGLVFKSGISINRISFEIRYYYGLNEIFKILYEDKSREHRVYTLLCSYKF